MFELGLDIMVLIANLFNDFVCLTNKLFLIIVFSFKLFHSSLEAFLSLLVGISFLLDFIG